MITKSTRKKGLEAEHLAVEYLKSKNYKILQTNYHAGNKGELDIIATDDSYIVFIEVKSLKASSTYSIYERITSTKKKD